MSFAEKKDFWTCLGWTPEEEGGIRGTGVIGVTGLNTAGIFTTMAILIPAWWRMLLMNG